MIKKLADGDKAQVSQESSGEARAELPVRVSSRVPQGAVWLRSATCSTSVLGSAMGAIKVGKV